MVTRSACLAAVLTVSAAAQAADSPSPARKPNVLFIAIDDLNHWVGYLGRNLQTKTPNLDKLAGRGVWFSQSYCAAPVCNPSRAALMSGLRPATTGVYENNDDWRTVVPIDKPLTTAFRNAGYYVCGAGKIYHGSYMRPEEWDDYLTRHKGGQPAPKGDGGVGGIRFGAVDATDEDMEDYHIVNYGIEQLSKPHDKPLFLAVGLHKPHMPWYVPRKYFDLHPLDKIELPPYREDDLNDLPAAGVAMARPEGDHAAILASGRWKEAIQAYLATISFCDAMVGRLIDAFDKSPLRENTVLVLWSDHGWHLGEKHHWRKFALWEETTRSPLIWVVPGLTPAGARCDRTVDFMSIYPTLMDLCGIPQPAHVQGTSIRTLLANPQAPWDKPALTTYRYMNHAVRSEAWRYIRYADGGEELYDEVKDPYEWTNLATGADQAGKKAELGRWMPTENKPDIAGGKRDKKATDGGERRAKQAKRAAQREKE